MITIIIPTYNRCRLLKKALESVWKQTIQEEKEIIIVDDASTDETQQYVEQELKGRVIYIRNPENKGACYSRNEGLKRASGECIAFLDSDNYWEPEFLQNRREYMDAGYDLVAGRILVIENLDGIERKTVVPGEPAEVLGEKEGFWHTMLLHNVIDTSSALIRRETALKKGGFDPEQKRYQDWDFFMNILTIPGIRHIFLDNVLVNNVRGEDSISYKQELLWPAMVRIFNKYLFVYEQADFVEEKARLLLTDPVVELDMKTRWKDLEQVLLSSGHMAEFVCMCMRMHQEEKLKREQAEGLNRMYRLEDDKKEARIRELEQEKNRGIEEAKRQGHEQTESLKRLYQCENEKKDKKIKELERQLDQKKWGLVGTAIKRALFEHKK